MHKHLNRLHSLLPVTAVFIGAVLIAGCSTPPAHPEDTQQVGLGTTESGSIFSSLRELDYLAPTENTAISSGDLLDIKVFQAEELSGKYKVGSDGKISLPLIGALSVSGKTPLVVETQLSGLLKQKYLQDPQVSILVESFTNQRVTVEGEVNKPGVYPIEGSITFLQAIALAGGLANLASPDKVVLFRRNGQQVKAYQLDIQAIRDGRLRDPYIRGNDQIVAHRSDSRYWFKEVKDMMSGLINPFN